MADMNKQTWQNKHPLQHIFFDVDSTLSDIEGIDVLAEWHQVGKEVAAITEQCMSQSGMSPAAYQQRLQLVRPSLADINRLGALYINRLTDGAQAVISILQSFNKQIYIVSAGIKQALLPLAKHLAIPTNQVFAVDIMFDKQGDYQAFDEQSHLTQAHGKTAVIQSVCSAKQTALLIGDGLSDLEAEPALNRFVGFGGHHRRQAIEQASPFYITANHLFALLPLILTQAEVDKLNDQQHHCFEIGLSAIDNNQVHIKESGNVQN